MRIFKNKRAVSPVVGVILMVAITIVLAATIYIWISSMSTPQSTTPSISFRAQILRNNTGNNNYDINLTVVSVQGSANWEDLNLTVTVNGSTWKDVQGTNWDNLIGTGTVQAGQVITITVPSKATVRVTIRHIPSNSIIYENTFQVP